MTFCVDLSKHFKTQDGEIIPVKDKIKKKLYKNPSAETFQIFKYDKEELTDSDFNSSGLFRSVVVKTNKIVSYSPPKSMQFIDFTRHYPLGNNIRIQELVEGTMINLFWNPKLDESGNYIIDETLPKDKNYFQISGDWELSTRTTVGAKVSYYQDPESETFRKMFLEACNELNLDLDKTPVSNENGIFNYSFVLQHPKNRIVKLIESPKIYLIAIYQIGYNSKTVKQLSINDMKSHEVTASNILFPEEFDNQDVTYDRVISSCKDMTMEYYKPGLVFYNDTTGERSKYRNLAYEEVRLLRGNSPKLQFQYLTLRKLGKIKDFLKYFPEKAGDFKKYRGLVHNFTRSLHDNYHKCYIQKLDKLITFPEQFRTHMYHLHQLFLNEYREKKGYIGLAVVVKYVNNLDSRHLMYALNYSIRERWVTKKNNEIKKASESSDEDVKDEKKNNTISTSTSSENIDNMEIDNDVDGL